MHRITFPFVNNETLKESVNSSEKLFARITKYVILEQSFPVLDIYKIYKINSLKNSLFFKLKLERKARPIIDHCQKIGNFTVYNNKTKFSTSIHLLVCFYLEQNRNNIFHIQKMENGNVLR